MTRNIFHIIISLVIPSLAFSCIGKNAEQAEGVPVTLTFNTRSPEDATLDAGEGIKNLRVIIVKEGHVVKHEKYDVSADATLASRSFTIFDVPVGTLDFYIIANHDATGISDWTPYDVGKTPTFLNLTDHIMTASNGQKTAPFPITGKRLGVSVSSTANRDLTFDITRSVVKLNFIFTNTGSDNIRLEEITLGTFLPDKTYLFPRESINLPPGTTYTSLEVTGVEMTLVPNAGNPKVIYIFENDAENTHYTLSVTADDKIYPPALIKLTNEENSIGNIPRNTQVNINVRINPTSMVILDYEVEEWTPVTVDIPSFN